MPYRFIRRRSTSLNGQVFLRSAMIIAVGLVNPAYVAGAETASRKPRGLARIVMPRAPSGAPGSCLVLLFGILVHASPGFDLH
jgi:hypothetical protein